MTSNQERVRDAKAAMQHVVDLATAVDPKAQQDEWHFDCVIPIRRGLRKGALNISRSDYGKMRIFPDNTEKLYASIQFPADGWAQDHKRHRLMSLRMQVGEGVIVKVDRSINGNLASREIAFGDESARQQGFLTIGQLTELLERRVRGRSLGTRLRQTVNLLQGKIV